MQPWNPDSPTPAFQIFFVVRCTVQRLDTVTNTNFDLPAEQCFEQMLVLLLDTQSLATIQKDGATEIHEAFSSRFGHLHESFLDSSVVGHGNNFLG